VATGYTAVVLAYTLWPASNVSLSGRVGTTAAVALLAALGSVGLPVALWVRYRLRAPPTLAAVVLLFWHVLVEFPPVGSGQGDSPGYLFVFVLAPLYVVAYLLVGGGEWWLRRRADAPTPNT
jgi:hypothetical protein